MTLDSLAVHPRTRQQIDAMSTSGAQAFILIGPSGIGKLTLAISLAESMLNIKELENYPYAKILSPDIDKKVITIENIRELRHFLSLKAVSSIEQNRVVILENAQTLSLDAQNALLKTLEEPPEGTIIILTTTSEQALLPTINSRVQKISVNRPSKELTKTILYKGSDSEFESLYAIGGGNPGLIHALINQENHPLRQATEQARTILKSNLFERLLLIDNLSKQKALLSDTLAILQQMAQISLSSSSNKDSTKWRSILEASYHAAEELSKNAQVKLVLLDLMLNM